MTKFEEVLQLINSDISARLALKTLVAEGCDQNRIVYFVYVYCRGASPDEAERTLRSARTMLKRWKRLSEKLREDAAEVERTLEEAIQKKIGEFGYPKDQHPATVMREFGDLLEKLQRNLGPVVNPKSGRNETLAYLCYLVKAATGREHYREIAVLINVFKQSGQDDIRLSDAIRNRVTRYEKTHTVTRRRRVRIPLREEAEADVAEWPKASPRKKKSSRSKSKTKSV